MTTPICTSRACRQIRLLAVLFAAITLGIPTARAEQRRLATISRYASQCDEYLVRGDAAVTPSPVLKNGLRLAAWDGADANDTTRVALASAIYFIPLPPGTRGVRVTVDYRRAPGATRPEAGFLFIRDPQVEQAYDNPGGAPANSPLADEPVFYGRTSPLPGNATQAQLMIGTDGLISERGVLELHLATGAGQVMDVDYLQVTAYADYQVATEQINQQVVIEQPYAYSYSYYYAGPWMSWTPAACTYYSFRYPTTPPFCFGGWWVWRSCYWNQHPWSCRPVSFTHCVPWPGPGIPYAHGGGPSGLMMPGFGVPAYRQQWYQRHFRVDAAKAPPEQLYREVRHRRQTLPPDRRPDVVRQAAAVSRHVTEADRELRKELGDQMPQRAARWRAQPRLARQDMRELQVKSPAFRQAMRNLAVPGSPPAPATPVSASVTPATSQPGSSTQGGIMMPLSIKPGAAGAPALIPVGGTAGPSLLPPPRISATPSRSSDAASYQRAPAPAAVTVQPAVKTQKTASAPNIRATPAVPGSTKPASVRTATRAPNNLTAPTPPEAVRETPRKRIRPEVPVPTTVQPPSSKVSERHPPPTLTPATAPVRQSIDSHFATDAANRTVPNSFQNTPRQQRGGGSAHTSKTTDAPPQNPAVPATPDGFSNPTFRHR
jgi:hypothetical protein